MLGENQKLRRIAVICWSIVFLALIAAVISAAVAFGVYLFSSG